MGYVSIPTDLTGKLNKVPDYDSGCFSLAQAGFVEKTHNFNNRELILQTLQGKTDSDCINDISSTNARPEIETVQGNTEHAIYITSINTIGIYNNSGSTSYYRILLWKGS